MPLILSVLQDDLAAFFSSIDEDITTASAAASWADTLSSYTATIIPPTTSQGSAITTLRANLLSIFNTNPEFVSDAAAAVAWESAFTTFALNLSAGMIQGAVASTTPPPGPVGFSNMFSVEFGTTQDAANRFAGDIDTWLRTGTFTTGPGVTSNWV
jgi:hypothetical protein